MELTPPAVAIRVLIQEEADTNRTGTRTSLVIVPEVVVPLVGCMLKSQYNATLAQQHALENSLQRQIGADQVGID